MAQHQVHRARHRLVRRTGHHVEPGNHHLTHGGELHVQDVADHRPLPLLQRGQVLAVDILHRDEVVAIDLADVVHPADAGVGDLPRVAHLAVEALEAGAVDVMAKPKLGKDVDLDHVAREVIEKVKRRYADATAALDDCDREQRLSPGRRPTFLVYRVICADEDVQQWDAEDLGNLRVALNALVRVFRLR